MAKKILSFNEALSELEEILALMENEQLDIDELFTKVERAGFLSRTCSEKLYKTENEINKILKDIENPQISTED